MVFAKPVVSYPNEDGRPEAQIRACCWVVADQGAVWLSFYSDWHAWLEESRTAGAFQPETVDESLQNDHWLCFETLEVLTKALLVILLSSHSVEWSVLTGRPYRQPRGLPAAFGLRSSLDLACGTRGGLPEYGPGRLCWEECGCEGDSVPGPHLLPAGKIVRLKPCRAFRRVGDRLSRPRMLISPAR
jgi:hypothetical protein